MSKKVLILSSTPRNGGNSDLLCDAFLKGAQEAGHSVEKIRLKDKTIHYCNGCGVCNNGLPCPIKDDAIEIQEKMIGADVIVMASPVYFYSISAQMKTLIDRCCPTYTRISNKEFYFIMTMADGRDIMMERTLEDFRGFLDCLNRAEEKGAIYASGVWQAGEVQQTKFMQQAYEMGKNILL